MKLYNGLSPNGSRVAIFLAEKGIEIPVKPINIMNGDTQKKGFLNLNSLGEVPVLALEDGSILTESIAICRYLDALYPSPSLFGDDAISQARIEMWNRRMELKVFNAIGDFARHEIEYFKPRGQVPEYAAFRRKEFAQILKWLDQEMADGRPYIAGEKFSIADITGMAMLVLTMFTQYDLPSDCHHLMRWANAVRKRPSMPKIPG